MLILAEFGYQHLVLVQVGCEFLLALFQTVEFGLGCHGRIRLVKGGVEDTNDVILVILLESSVLDE